MIRFKDHQSSLIHPLGRKVSPTIFSSRLKPTSLKYKGCELWKEGRVAESEGGMDTFGIQIYRLMHIWLKKNCILNAPDTVQPGLAAILRMKQQWKYESVPPGAHVTFYWAIPCLISSYRVSGSAGRHLVCPLSPQGLFRLKDPLKRMSCPQTERSQWHMNRPRSVRLGCIRADISFPRSERCWNVILHSVSQVAHALVPFPN